MLCSVEFYDSENSSSEEERKKLKVFRRKLRERSNPLDFPEQAFLKRFRLTKQAFRYVLDSLDLNMGIRSTAIPPILKLAATLELLGGGSYQWCAGNDYAAPMAQSTISLIKSLVVSEIENKLCPIWIKFEFKNETKCSILRQHKIPGVVGCLDGTHVMLLKPVLHEHTFFNRKGKHSINVMLICDEQLRITAVNAKYGGSAHDSFVWLQSTERALMESLWERGQRNAWLLADSGYKLEPFVITPYRSAPENSAEAYFNAIHSKARNKIERCIGVWKGRWRILLEERKCRYPPRTVAQIVNATAALHNICAHFNVPIIDEEPDRNVQQDFEIAFENCNNARHQAEQIRNNIRDMLLTN